MTRKKDSFAQSRQSVRVVPAETSFPDEGTTSRRAVRQVEPLHFNWIENLLAASVEIPGDASPDEVTRAFVDTIFDICGDVAVGVCIARPDQAEQSVIKREPDDRVSARGIDPTRLFPGYLGEFVAPLGDRHQGSTLHIATNDASLAGPSSDASSVAIFARRAAPILARVLDIAIAHRHHASRANRLHAVESQLIQADKLASFGQAVAGMIHDLNNPLTTIVAYSDYLIRRAAARVPTESEDVERLRRIGESANRMLRLTRDLVSYARPSGNRASIIVVRQVIEQALAFCEHVLGESSAAVDCDFGEEVLTVRGMPEQLAQIFVNLLTNACHALPKVGGVIRIAASRVGDNLVRIVVEDNGHGIAGENIAKVFDPFFTTKREGEGTGLGLAIVRSVVEQHNGAVAVFSDTHGTRFTLDFPVPIPNGG